MEIVVGVSYCGLSLFIYCIGLVGVLVDCEFKIINEMGEILGDNE